MQQILCLFFIILYNSSLSYILFQEDEVRHVRQAETEKPLEPCYEDTLMQFLADMGIVVPEDIIHLALESIPQMCKKVENKIKQINEYTAKCKPPPPDDLFMSLIRGVKQLNIKFCGHMNPFPKEWEKYSTCLMELGSDLRSCNGPGDWNEEERDEICKVYKEIKDCHYVKAAKVCGKKAAKSLEDLIVLVINSAINVKCPKSPHPSVRDVMPEKYVNQINHKMRAQPENIMFIIMGIFTSLYIFIM